VSVEEIARLVGHSSTTTELVGRTQIRPGIQTDAVVLDAVQVRPKGSNACSSVHSGR
jgi:hypothetical protein